MRVAVAIMAALVLSVGCGGGESTADGGMTPTDGGMVDPDASGGGSDGGGGGSDGGGMTTDGGGGGSDGGGGGSDAGITGPFTPDAVIAVMGGGGLFAIDADPARVVEVSHADALLPLDDHNRYVWALSPDGTMVAYASESSPGSPGEVWVATVDEAPVQTRIGSSSGRIDRLMWTSDGARVLWSDGRLVSVLADGTGEVVLAAAVQDAVLSSADRIAYTIPDPTFGETLGIHLVDPDGTNDVDVVPLLTGVTGAHDPDFEDGYPVAWSPDGSRLVVVGTYPEPDFGSSFEHHKIYVMNADGTGVVQIAGPTDVSGFAFDAYNVTWSPDGSRISYRLAVRTTRRLHTILPDGTGDVECDATGWLEAWSPDGQHVAISALGRALRVAPADTLVTTTVVSALSGFTTYSPDGAHLGWSPDSQSLAYQSNEGGGELELFVVQADGTNATRVSRPLMGAEAVSHDFSWTEDSSRLVYGTGQAVYDVARPVVVAPDYRYDTSVDSLIEQIKPDCTLANIRLVPFGPFGHWRALGGGFRAWIPQSYTYRWSIQFECADSVGSHYVSIITYDVGTGRFGGATAELNAVPEEFAPTW